MKLKSILAGKLALVAAFYSVMIAFSPHANAIPLTIGDAHGLGSIDPAKPTTVNSATLFVNTMIGLSVGGSSHVIINGHDNLVTRSNNAFHPLPTAVFALTGHGTTVDLGTGLYSYLFAKYGSSTTPGGFAEVWYVRDLSGSVTIPVTANGFHLSLWKVFTPGASVPDGGATVMLLGAAIAVLATARRFLTS